MKTLSSLDKLTVTFSLITFLDNPDNVLLSRLCTFIHVELHHYHSCRVR